MIDIMDKDDLQSDIPHNLNEYNHDYQKQGGRASEGYSKTDLREPVVCIIGATGCGKSTFCHLLTGSDPRTNKDIFLAQTSVKSVTNKIEI